MSKGTCDLCGAEKVEVKRKRIDYLAGDIYVCKGCDMLNLSEKEILRRYR